MHCKRRRKGKSLNNNNKNYYLFSYFSSSSSTKENVSTHIKLQYTKMLIQIKMNQSN